jgi:hypothetical protein
VILQVIGAFVRAALVMLMISTPALLVPGVSPEAQDVVATIGFCAAAIVFIEYAARYPTLIEFRYAPPFNRMRFLSLFVNVFLLSAMFRGLSEASAITELITAVGVLIGRIIDFPFSPVGLISLMLPPDASLGQVELLRASAGLSYFSSLIMMAGFAIMLRVRDWPLKAGAFNMWVNLPNFDPQPGADIVAILQQDARVNIMLGLSLPFVAPLFATVAAELFVPYALANPQTMIWTVALWAGIPAGMIMRGLALGRIAEILDRQRKRAREDAAEDLATA